MSVSSLSANTLFSPHPPSSSTVLLISPSIICSKPSLQSNSVPSKRPQIFVMVRRKKHECRPLVAASGIAIKELSEEDKEEIPPLFESEANSRPRRIALFVEPSPFAYVSGYKNRFQNFIRYLREMGDEVMVVTTHEGVPQEFYGAKLIGSLSFPCPWYQKVPLSLALSPRIISEVAKFKPDIIHASSPGIMVFGALIIAKLLCVPIVMSYHTHVPVYIPRYTFSWLVTPMWLVLKFLHRAADLTLVPSAAIGKDLEVARVTAANKIRLWNKGVDSECFHPKHRSPEMRLRLSNGQPERPLIVHVGRLGVEKSLGFLKGIMDRLPEARIAFVGDGPYRADLEKMFEGMPAVFTGMLQGDELSQAYASGDVFVMPSESETLGFVVLEAMSSGLPVVAARAGGIPEIISLDHEGKTGFLYSPGDVEDCLSKLVPLLHDAELRESIGQAARKEMEKFDWRAATRKIRNEQYDAAIWFWRKKRAMLFRPFQWLTKLIFQSPQVKHRKRRAAASTKSDMEVLSKNIMEDDSKFVLGTYSRTPLVLASGKGCKLYNIEGKEYLDFTSGIAVNALGHGDPDWINAVTEQASVLTHVSNIFYSLPQVELAKRLVEVSFADRVFFSNSGTEANEAAIKFCRKFQRFNKPDNSEPPTEFISFSNSFHGRTMGALALTSKEHYRSPFQPVMPGVTFLEYGDISASTELIQSGNIAAVFVEPIQGEGGIYSATKEFLQSLRSACDDAGSLLVYDEVQCGLGRSGYLWAHEAYGVYPDVMTLAKPLAGGLPIGAVLVTERVANAISYGDHGSTFAGGPLICAAAIAVLDKIKKPSFLSSVSRKGKRLKCMAMEKLGGNSHVREVRGLGLIVGIELDVPASVFVDACRQSGLLILTAGKGNIIRLVPPLIISDEELERAVEIMLQCLPVLDQ